MREAHLQLRGWQPQAPEEPDHWSADTVTITSSHAMNCRNKKEHLRETLVSLPHLVLLQCAVPWPQVPLSAPSGLA